MTYNVFGGTLSLTQSINLLKRAHARGSATRTVVMRCVLVCRRQWTAGSTRKNRCSFCYLFTRENI